MILKILAIFGCILFFILGAACFSLSWMHADIERSVAFRRKHGGKMLKTEGERITQVVVSAVVGAVCWLTVTVLARWIAGVL